MGMGLCVNPRFMPTVAELDALKPTFLRSIAYSLSDVWDLADTGYPILLTLNNECAEVGDDWHGWDEAIEDIAERAGGSVFAVGIGNEFDDYWIKRQDDVPPDFAANLIRRASKILRPYGIKTIATSVVSERWGEYLQRMMDLCRDAVDYADIHAYGQIPDGWNPPSTPWGFGRLSQTLTMARQIAGKPVIMSEIGVTIQGAGDMNGVAKYMLAVDETVKRLGVDVCPFASWFCWRDEIGKPGEEGEQGFGLRTMKSAGDIRRPAWSAFAAMNATIDPEQPKGPPMTPEHSAFGYIWRAVNPHLDWNDEIAGFGIPTYWRQHLEEMGSPLSAEIDAGDGAVLQAFTRGVFRWTGTGVERVG